MGKIILSASILGDNFGVVVLQHAEYYATIMGLDKEQVSKDLNSGATGEYYVDMFHKHFGKELTLRLE